MLSREHLDTVALQLAQHLYDRNCRSFCFIGEYAALLSGWSPSPPDAVSSIQIYVSMSTSLRVWLETYVAPFSPSLFTLGAGTQRWLLQGVQLEFVRENPSFYLLSSPAYVDARPSSLSLEGLVQEPQFMLAETLRDWQEQLDNASQARLVRFWLSKDMRFGWRHAGPAAAEIACEFLGEIEDVEDRDGLGEQFAAVGLRLDGHDSAVKR
ncbi:hypothetical protein AURDEDRAFT_176250 [Auricularia subglabra TFB-10046 SS5]|uniref:Uncharacterized protein n=1 Tax=Auricularia subglabra (strain TFB-10046 / SS5) TaxID=717982 RepID=J0WQC0_AURST|nr:hypothetical protein AURDEDRAFT_176250 [Auricularia subglabra TFB-10046 SS5]